MIKIIRADKRTNKRGYLQQNWILKNNNKSSRKPGNREGRNFTPHLTGFSFVWDVPDGRLGGNFLKIFWNQILQSVSCCCCPTNLNAISQLFYTVYICVYAYVKIYNLTRYI